MPSDSKLFIFDDGILISNFWSFKISSNNYCLYIQRGFALSIWEILLETADQFGYEVLER